MVLPLARSFGAGSTEPTPPRHVARTLWCNSSTRRLIVGLASALSSDDHHCLDMLLYLAPSMEHDGSIWRRIVQIGYL
jgi:hypothetical protein